MPEIAILSPVNNVYNKAKQSSLVIRSQLLNKGISKLDISSSSDLLLL